MMAEIQIDHARITFEARDWAGRKRLEGSESYGFYPFPGRQVILGVVMEQLVKAGVHNIEVLDNTEEAK